MEIKLFGKSLFSVKKNRAEALVAEATSKTESKFLPNFYEDNGGDGFVSISSGVLSNWTTGTSAVQVVGVDAAPKDAKKDDPAKKTPKDVYNLKLLNDEAFKLKADPAYVDEQIAAFKDKLALISSEEYDMRRGVSQIRSVIMRMENRKKYPDFREFFEQFPYTMTERILDLVKEHDYLKLGQVAQFLADLPKEASDVMKNYNAQTNKLCGKQAVYYIIADKKDFEKTQKRRDPILLAQSPFGHFWQILGAWDKEMLLVDEL